MKRIILATLIISISITSFFVLISWNRNDDTELANKIAKSTHFVEVYKANISLQNEFIAMYKKDKKNIKKYRPIDKLRIIHDSYMSDLQKKDTLKKMGIYETTETQKYSEIITFNMKLLNEEFPELLKLTTDSKKRIFHQATSILKGRF